MKLRFARSPKSFAQKAHASKRSLPAPKSIESEKSSHRAVLRASGCSLHLFFGFGRVSEPAQRLGLAPEDRLGHSDCV